MSTQVTTAFVQQYSANVQMLSQQMGSRLRDAVRVENMVGKNAFFDQVGKATAQKRTTRHADTPQIDTPHARRRVSLVDYEYADLIDDQDKVKMLIDPTSAYAMAAAAAMGRAMDDEIIAAALGTAYTGETGSTSTALPAGQQIANGGTDLTVAKLRSAKKILDLSDVDPSIPRYIACGPDQIENLLSDTSVTSSDFNTVKALVQGEISAFMGFNFIVTNRLSKTGNIRSCFAWAEDGLALAVGRDVMARIDERNDKGYATQVYYCMSIGSTRMEEEKVVQIDCDES
ncbi:MAG: phage capsid protein [Pelagibacteraceae bacterium]